MKLLILKATYLAFLFFILFATSLSYPVYASCSWMTFTSSNCVTDCLRYDAYGACTQSTTTCPTFEQYVCTSSGPASSYNTATSGCNFIDGCICPTGQVIDSGQSCSYSSSGGNTAAATPAPTAAPVVAPTNNNTTPSDPGNPTDPGPTDPGPTNPTNPIIPTGPVCGDNSCTGFETCGSCPSDCGVCPVPTTTWWQVLGGNSYAGITSGYGMVSAVPSSTTCTAPDCSPLLFSYDRASTATSYGYPFTAGSFVNSNNNQQLINPTVTTALGTYASRYYETYSFFYRKTNLGANPVDDFAGSATDAQKPATGKEAYFHDGDLTIQDQWDVTAGQSFVVFVDGNLTLSDTGNVGELIKVAEGGFLAFIVSGNITISNDVGNTTLTSTTGNVEGVYIADGTITVASKGAAAGGDERFIGEGTFVGWSGVELDRDYSDGGARAAENNSKPAEQFVYRPDLVKNAPEVMKHPHSIWQETK